MKDLKIIEETDNFLVIDKEPGISIDEIANLLPENSLPRKGIVHRLDKDTSGILLVAKNQEALYSLQKEFKEKRVVKKYLGLVVGNVKENQREIETFLTRSPKDRRKQKVYTGLESKNLRKAVSCYKVKERFKDYTLLEITLKTGRKHQIRVQFAWLNYPLAGDKLYGFKNQPCPKNLERQFLHACYLKIQGKEFFSPLPKDLEKTLELLDKYDD